MVFAFTTAATDEVAVVSAESVWVFTSATTDEVALWRSAKVERAPEVRDAAVSVRAP